MQDAQKLANEESSAKTPTASELGKMRWSVISFERCEMGGVTFAEAIYKLSELEAAGISGLCIVTDEAAARLKS